MQVSVEQVSNLGRKLTISVPADKLDTQINARLRDLGRNVRLNGFRKGKVPPKVIEQRFGAQVRGEAVSDLIRDTFGEAVKQESLRPAVPPTIETTGRTDDGAFSYVATFEVMPEIGSIDVSSLKVKRPTASVEEGDVDQMIETLRVQRRSWVPVERASQAGDMVLFESYVMAGEERIPAEGVERSGTVLGSNAIFAEIEGNLTGLAQGESKSFELTFPAEHRAEKLAGKTGTMYVMVSKVSEGRLPEVDEAFMASFGVPGGDVDVFRKEVRANLERELRGALMQRLKADVVSRLIEAHQNIEFPSRMIEAEASGLAQQAEQQARQRGQKDAKADPAAFMDVAKQRVCAAVLLGELARQNELRMDPERVKEMLASIASTYEDPMQVIELYRNDTQLMRGLESRVIEDQVIDWIADHADLTVEQLTFAEVMRPKAG
ncbi:MAG: trigger factor [Xanthomonadales bacterium]|nr:trigger factor [Xanthomonadales bacterium]